MTVGNARANSGTQAETDACLVRSGLLTRGDPERIAQREAGRASFDAQTAGVGEHVFGEAIRCFF